MRRLAALTMACGALLVAPASGAPPAGNGVVAFADGGTLWFVEPDGTAPRRVEAGTDEVLDAGAWSPDGTKLAYSAAGGAFVIGANGLGGRVLAANGSARFRVACWLSNDLVALTGVTDAPPGSDIWVVGTDGAGLRRLTASGVQKTVSRQGCSPDGSLVAYAEAPPSGGAYTVPVTGGTPVRLTPGGALDDPPAFAPDGASVAIPRLWLRRGTAGTTLVRQALTSGGADTLSPVPGARDPRWSPEGSRLVYWVAGCVCGRFPFTTGDIRVVDASGAGDHSISAPVGGYPRDFEPSWSPDGTRVLFWHQGLADRTIRQTNMDGTCRVVVAGPSPTRVPVGAWQPLAGRPPMPPLECVDFAVDGAGVDPFFGAATGAVVHVSVRVVNRGTQWASNVTLDGSQVPADLTAASAQATQGSCSAETLRCAVGDLAPGAVVSATVGLRSSFHTFPGAFEAREYTVRVSSDSADLDTDDNTSRSVFRVYSCTIVGYGLVRGTAADDVVCGLGTLLGGAGDDLLSASSSQDRLVGGPGRDELRGNGGDDRLEGWDGKRDRLDCGSGRHDLALGDLSDEFIGCEAIARTPARCTKVGGIGSDRQLGTPRGDVLCGLTGADTLKGLAGADRLDGGRGNDALDGGPGRDALVAGPGYDVLVARDDVRDRIECGSEIDTVVADPIDRVARDCETVRRRPIKKHLERSR